MKTPSTDLFRIIQTMSPAERRQFRSQHHSEHGSRTLELFNIISDMESYDENLVKQQLSDDSFARNLKVHKNRLQQLVMNFLRCLRTDKTAAQRIREQIDFIDVLFQRRLVDMGFDALAKLEKYCEQMEEYELLLVVLGFKARQQVYIYRDKVAPSILQIQDCLDKITNFTRHAQINNEINILYTSPDENKDQHLRDFIAAELIPLEEKLPPKTFTAQRMANHSLSVYCQLTQQYEQATAYTRDSVQRCEANPLLLKENPRPYFNVLINHVIVCRLARQFEEGWQHVNTITQLAQTHPEFEPQLIYPYYEGLLALKHQQKYQQALDFFEQTVVPHIEKYQIQQSYTARLAYSAMFGVSLRLKNEALQQQLLLIFQANSTQLDDGLAQFALIYEAILYIEQKSWSFLASWVEALLKRLQRHKVNYPILRFIANFALKLASRPETQHRQLYAKHLADFEPVYQKHQTFGQTFIETFDYRAWLQHKIAQA